ncbi:hypothetical protein, partial [uncultured Sutterella sp.]|uniref:hypothetical protein n=1 Tax=uncultured Sutterella sp. TaxID=286133 RepID=UPI00261FA993
TRDLNLGKVALYQLSYSRIEKRDFTDFKKYVKSFALKHQRSERAPARGAKKGTIRRQSLAFFTSSGKHR